ncbi:hypothetical protein AB0O64_32370 [Streptomyces sp. NPDC088341]|uniref:hypothetical protein n=1 Tax=Streptomyces sp. NPDC088341 TaxID=3154870 RepID=UPI0034238EC4
MTVNRRTISIPATPPAPKADGPGVRLPDRAAPAVGALAADIADASCALADTAGPGTWSVSAVEDTVDAIDALVTALSSVDPNAARILATIPAATTALLRHIGAQDPPDEPTTGPATIPLPTPRTTRTRRRGLGHGYQGIHIPE